MPSIAPAPQQHRARQQILDAGGEHSKPKPSPQAYSATGKAWAAFSACVSFNMEPSSTGACKLNATALWPSLASYMPSFLTCAPLAHMAFALNRLKQPVCVHLWCP